MLVDRGLTVAEEWWITDVEAELPDARFGPLEDDVVTALRVLAPPAYDPRGPVLLIRRVHDASRFRQIAVSAARAGEAALVELLPPSPRRALDLGCGDDALAALVLDARPQIDEALAIDVSPPMLARARERFADDPRVYVREHDLRELITAFGAFDLVVSGFAIHHLPDQRKQSLFGEIATSLRSGGVFANLEVVASPTPELHQTFLVAIGRKDGDPEDRLVDVETQLHWMRAAGLEQVDCMWKWRGFALLAGSAPRP